MVFGVQTGRTIVITKVVVIIAAWDIWWRRWTIIFFFSIDYFIHNRIYARIDSAFFAFFFVNFNFCMVRQLTICYIRSLESFSNVECKCGHAIIN